MQRATVDTVRRRLVAAAVLAPVAPLLHAADPAWERIEKAARGQTVHFNAWAGSERINAYLQWAAAELDQRWGVKLDHVLSLIHI